MTEETNIIAAKHLGQKSVGSELYDKSLLVAIPRSLNRKIYDINSEDLPFSGVDIWHAYEFSVLTENGVPVTRLLKLKYSADSEFIVESKSLKLYLNSFNMSKFGKNTIDCLNVCKNIIEKDLSDVLKTEVSANFLDNETTRINVFSNYVNLMSVVNDEKITAKSYKESPELLVSESIGRQHEYFYMYDSLRSNCRVTHQPDFGDVFIYYKSEKHIIEDSLVKYLISFRKEYHFHEECVEMIYKRLYDLLDKSDLLFVCALYTRRGGIDITPARWSKNFEPDDALIISDLTKFARYGVKQ